MDLKGLAILKTMLLTLIFLFISFITTCQTQNCPVINEDLVSAQFDIQECDYRDKIQAIVAKGYKRLWVGRTYNVDECLLECARNKGECVALTLYRDGNDVMWQCILMKPAPTMSQVMKVRDDSLLDGNCNLYVVLDVGCQEPLQEPTTAPTNDAPTTIGIVSGFGGFGDFGVQVDDAGSHPVPPPP